VDGTGFCQSNLDGSMRNAHSIFIFIHKNLKELLFYDGIPLFDSKCLSRQDNKAKDGLDQ
jgi:hypothetical protein